MSRILRRPTPALVALLALALVSGAARGRADPPQPPAAPPAAPSAPAVPPGSLCLTLRADTDTALTVYHDQPITLSLSLSNPQAEEAVRWNRAADRGLRDLEEEHQAGKVTDAEYAAAKARMEQGKQTPTSVTLGTADTPWQRQVVWEFRRDGKPADVALSPLPGLSDGAPVAVLDERGRASAWYGISPTEMKKLAHSTLTLRAVIAGVGSEEIKIVVRPEPIPEKAEEALTALANYLVYAQDFAAAEAAAERILKANAKSVDGLALRGDARAGLGRLAEALADFEAALKLTPKTYEPPIVLAEKISALKEQLKPAAAGR